MSELSTQPRPYDVERLVMRYRAGGVGPKATLLAMWGYFGEHDGEWSCWPSLAKVAADSEQSVRTVKRHVAEFVAAGVFVKRARYRDGHRGQLATEWVLNLAVLAAGAEGLGAKLTPESPTQVSSGADSGAICDTTRVPSATSAPYIEPLGNSEGSGRRRRRLPDGFTVDRPMRLYAASKGLGDEQIESEAEAFVAYHQAHGTTMLDWPAAWRTWVMNAKRWSSPRRVNGNGDRSPRERVLDKLRNGEIR